MTDETPKEPEAEGAVTATDQNEEAAETNEEEEGEKKPEKLHQEVELKDIGPCKKHVKVTIERGDVDSRLNEKYSKLVGEANVPGFRPGKAPRKIIERRFAKEVAQEVKAEIMFQSLEQLADDNLVSPLSAPDLDPRNINVPDTGPMVYEFDVEVRPEFELPSYKGLKLRRPTRTFTEEDVTDEESRILAPYGQLVPKPEGNAQPGDYVIADITTRDGDRLVGELKELKIRIEPRLAFRDAVAERFADQMKGASSGDKRRVDITLSENAADASLRGRTVTGEVTVKDVKAMRLPELSEGFLAQFGIRTEAQLRERIRVLLQRRLEYQQRQSAREQVLAHIAGAAHWELPQDLLARQARKTMARRIMEMRSSGMSEDEIRGRERILQQDVLRSTELALKELFVLQKIAEVEKLEVDDADIDDEIERIADQTDESPRRVRARLEKDDLLDAVAGEILERKALDLVLENAEYEDFVIGRKDEESPVSTVEEQAVPGEMNDPTVAAPEKAEEKAPEAEETPSETQT